MVHENNLQLWQWTINEEEDIKRLLDLKIDAIITDYPEKALRLREEMD